MARAETDPVDWKLDANNDLVIPIEWTRGSPAIAQAIGIKIRAFKGDWFLDRSLGVPYLEGETVVEADAIIGSNFDSVKTEAIFRRLLLTTEGVAKIETLTATFSGSTRIMTISYQVWTIYGHLLSNTVALEIA